MALSGNLGFVPLDEVLRLLARAGQKGSLEIQGGDVSGRIFFTKRGITLATTRSDHELREHLINSQFVDNQQLAAAEGGVGTLKTVADEKPEFVHLLREMTVESLYQLSRNGSTFEVDEESVTPYASPNPFELEAVLSDAAKRADEWAEVEALLSDMAGVIKMKRDLGERTEVTVSRDAWKLLSELGSGSSVSDMASRLGTTEFWTAKVASDLTSKDLLTVADVGEEVSEPAPAPAPQPTVDEWIGEDTDSEISDESEIVEVADVSPDDADHTFEEPVEATAPGAGEEVITDEVDHEVAEPEDNAAPVGADLEDIDPNESWWVEPDRSASDEETPFEGGADTEAAPDERRNRLGMFSPALGGDDDGAEADVEEDTEAFLEKVFSQLEEPEAEASAEATDETQEPNDDDVDEGDTSGHGLLRRRRLGSILTDSSKTND